MKRLLYFLIPALALGGLIVWRLNAKHKQQAAQDQAVAARKKAPPSVDVAPAILRDIVHTYVAVGSVESPFNNKIAAKVTGRIDYLQLREGAPVTHGEVLARIDPSQVEALVHQQQAAVAEAQQRLSQAVFTTNPTNVGVTTGIRQQEAGVNTAQANLNQVQQNYNATVAAAQSAVTDAQGRVDTANSAIANAQATIQSAQANLNNAQVRYNRTYELYKQGYVAAQDVDDARTTVNVQQGALDVATAQLAGAKASRDSALAQKSAAENQVSIAITKGKSDIAAAKAAVRQAQAGLALARANTAQRPAYQANLAALRATVSSAQAQLRDAESQLSDTILLSPVDGFVTARYLDPGDVVTAGEAILALQTLKQVYVTTSIPEEISRRIYTGMRASVVLDALPGRTFTGNVTQVDPAADPTSRQFQVRLTLNNAQDIIKPGMFSHVTFVTQRTRNAVVIPREAVKQGKSGPMVVVVNPDTTAHQVPIQTGDSDDTGIQITQGVQPGQNVVTLSLLPVRDGQKVHIGNMRPPAAGKPGVRYGGGGANVNPSGAVTAPGGGPNAPNYLGTPSGASSSGSGTSTNNGTNNGVPSGGAVPNTTMPGNQGATGAPANGSTPSVLPGNPGPGAPGGAPSPSTPGSSGTGAPGSVPSAPSTGAGSTGTGSIFGGSSSGSGGGATGGSSSGGSSGGGR